MADQDKDGSGQNEASKGEERVGYIASGNPEVLDDIDTGRSGGGDSGGGAYPNPHKGKKPKKDGFMASGGQTEMAYHGTGQLGERKTGENPNAPAKED
ncbi:MAG: hypothetical protein JWN69_293 [Alphaproteobacteria bacterium]|jgi:hypothetical protein|nr:hypothetical protein [Alphaproteobacteria bacterium]